MGLRVRKINFFVQFYFSPKIKIYLSSLAVAVVLLLAVFWGVGSGRLQAQGGLVLQNAQSLQAGLRYFYADQNRFPTAEEFQDQNLMLSYFNAFPPAELAAGPCSGSFSYKRPAAGSYELDFCLPASSGGLTAGWHAISGQPPASN